MYLPCPVLRANRKTCFSTDRKALSEICRFEAEFFRASGSCPCACNSATHTDETGCPNLSLQHPGDGAVRDSVRSLDVSFFFLLRRKRLYLAKRRPIFWVRSRKIFWAESKVFLSTIGFSAPGNTVQSFLGTGIDRVRSFSSSVPIPVIQCILVRQYFQDRLIVPQARPIPDVLTIQYSRDVGRAPLFVDEHAVTCDPARKLLIGTKLCEVPTTNFTVKRQECPG